MNDFEATFKADGGAFDDPSENDFIAEHVLGAEEPELPAYVNLNVLDHTHHQGDTMHCTAYGTTHVEEIMNALEHHMSVLCDPEEQWANEVFEQGVAYKDGMEKEGTSLQIALQALLHNGLYNKTTALPFEKFQIDGYARIGDSLADIKKWLAKGYALLSGSGHHCYAICGYSDVDQEVICLNSYGRNNNRPKGEFRVPFTQIGSFFSKYVLFDKKEYKMIFKDVTENSPMAKNIKKMLDLGIMKGYGTSENAQDRSFLPEKPITRAEMAEVIGNLIDKFGLVVKA